MNNFTRQKALIILLLMFCGVTAATAQTLMWAKKMGSTGADFGRATSFDGSGNVYTAGEFRGTADFDPGPVNQPLTSKGIQDIFISKLDANGNYLWARSIGGTNTDVAYGVAAAQNGDVYMTGSFQEASVDFDPGPLSFPLSSSGGTDIFVCKFKANGDFAWAVKIGGAGGDIGYKLVLDNNENVYVTGSFTGVVDFDPGGGTQNLGTAGVTAGFVLKLNSAGAYQWASNIGGGGIGIKLDNAGNILVTGSFSGTVDFNPGTAVNNLTAPGTATDVFVCKLNPAGEYVWAVNMGGTGADVGYAIGVDRNNHVYTTGSFSGTADFNPGGGTNDLIAKGGTDVFISRLDASGNFVWAKSIGGAEADRGSSLTVDSDDKLYIGGEYIGIVDFNPGSGVKSDTSWACCNGAFGYSRDAFVLKLDNAGDFEWFFGIKSQDGSEQLHSINMDPDNNLYVTGSFGATANFAPAPASDTLIGASDDIFVAKYAQPSCKCYRTLNISTGCAFVTVNGQYYTSNGTYTQILKNAANCDSVLTLVIALNNAIPTTVSHKACDSYTFGGTLYTSGGTYTHTFKNVSNCDSIVVLNLTINKSVTTQVTQGACGSYTYNGTTYTTSGNYTHHFQTVNQCDSTVNLNLTINQSSAPTRNSVTACSSYLFGGTTYTVSGAYTHTFKTVNNCDSVATIDLTINQGSTNQVSDTACGSFIYNGTTYTTSGSYIHYFKNANNCDSVVTLNLLIRNGSSSALNITSCDQYTLNGQTYSLSGIYTQTVPATNGCDSVITLNLTLNQTPDARITPNGNTLSASGGDSYQWLDCDKGNAAIPSATSSTLLTDGKGRYAVVITTNGCKDTSDCFDASKSGIKQYGENVLTLYPNPADQQVVISSTVAFSNAAVRLIHTNGQRTLYKTDYSGNKIVLDLGGLATGVYVVEIIDAEKIYRTTLLKQ